MAQLGDWQVSYANADRAPVATGSAADNCAENLILYRGVAQLVAREVWDFDAAGSSPVTPTKTTGMHFCIPVVFYQLYGLEPEKARSVKKKTEPMTRSFSTKSTLASARISLIIQFGYRLLYRKYKRVPNRQF